MWTRCRDAGDDSSDDAQAAMRYRGDGDSSDDAKAAMRYRGDGGVAFWTTTYRDDDGGGAKDTHMVRLVDFPSDPMCKSGEIGEYLRHSVSRFEM